MGGRSDPERARVGRGQRSDGVCGKSGHGVPVVTLKPSDPAMTERDRDATLPRCDGRGASCWQSRAGAEQLATDPKEAIEELHVHPGFRVDHIELRTPREEAFTGMGSLHRTGRGNDRFSGLGGRPTRCACHINLHLVGVDRWHPHSRLALEAILGVVRRHEPNLVVTWHGQGQPSGPFPFGCARHHPGLARDSRGHAPDVREVEPYGIAVLVEDAVVWNSDELKLAAATLGPETELRRAAVDPKQQRASGRGAPLRLGQDLHAVQTITHPSWNQEPPEPQPLRGAPLATNAFTPRQHSDDTSDIPGRPNAELRIPWSDPIGAERVCGNQAGVVR